MTTAAAAVAVAKGGKTLTIYSQLPLQGDSRPQSEDVVNGEKLALEEAGGKAGNFTIKYQSLDDATAAAGKWEPGQVSANARKARRTTTRSPTSASSTRARRRSRSRSSTRPGILQVSPSNTYVGLTRSEGADKGEPRQVLPVRQAHLRPRRAR